MRCSALLPKILTIFEGTSEIQQLVIARAISGLRVE
jgi:alkylation response protein AidB-like acyl-CoA dehydrogenase